MRRPLLSSVPLTVALLTLVVMILVVMVSAALLSTPAIAQEGGGATAFVARPADGSPVAAQGGWFHFAQAAPGTELPAELALRNDGTAPLSLRLAAVDAGTAQRGGVAYGLPGDAVEQVGSWVDLERDTVELPPGSSAVVAFTVRVPGDAVPGDHLGGVAVWAPGEAGESAAHDGMAPGVVISTRQVLAVQVEVPGAVTRRLEISDVRVAARPDGPHLEIVIDNTGGRLAKGQGNVLVDGQALGGEFAVDTMVPGTQVAYAVAWPDADLGRDHEVQVSLDYEGGQDAWEGTVSAGERVREALRDWDTGGGAVTFDGRILLWLLAGLAAALLIILTLVRRRGPQPDRVRSS